MKYHHQDINYIYCRLWKQYYSEVLDKTTTTCWTKPLPQSGNIKHTAQ